MPASSQRSTTALSSPPAELHLASWPLRDEGLPAWLLLVGTVALATLVGYLTDSLATGLVSLSALWLAMWRLWIPIRYDVGSRGITQSVLGRQRRIAWSHIDRYEVCRRGVLIVATSETTPLRALQARYVPWGRHRRELLEVVRYYLDR